MRGMPEYRAKTEAHLPRHLRYLTDLACLNSKSSTPRDATIFHSTVKWEFCLATPTSRSFRQATGDSETGSRSSGGLLKHKPFERAGAMDAYRKGSTAHDTARTGSRQGLIGSLKWWVFFINATA
jgi:hypothetical protein